MVSPSLRTIKVQNDCGLPDGQPSAQDDLILKIWRKIPRCLNVSGKQPNHPERREIPGGDREKSKDDVKQRPTHFEGILVGTFQFRPSTAGFPMVSPPLRTIKVQNVCGLPVGQPSAQDD